MIRQLDALFLRGALWGRVRAGVRAFAVTSAGLAAAAAVLRTFVLAHEAMGAGLWRWSCWAG